MEKLNQICRKYEYLGAPELSLEISDLTDAEFKSLKTDLRSIGWIYNRTERRYKTCTVAIFDEQD
jgi:hypothetical protein